MTTGKTFDPAKRKKLNNPLRLEWVPPRRVADLIDLKENGHYLDVGAGTGYLTRAIARIAPEATIHALDIEPLMVAEMKTNLEPENIQARLMERNLLPFADQSLDGLWSITVYHEFGKSNPILQEMCRVLRPGARVLIVDWLKKEEASKQGPPLEHRCHVGKVIRELISTGFHSVTEMDGFTHHFAIQARA